MINSEVDPEYFLYTKQLVPHPELDEIELRNPAKKIELFNFTRKLSKTVAGHFINELSVKDRDLPGTFGVRLIEIMPTNKRDVHVENIRAMELGFSCDHRPAEVPELLEQALRNDYLSDDERDMEDQ